MLIKTKVIDIQNYYYAGYPYQDRGNLRLILDSNIDEDVFRRKLDILNFSNEPFILGEIQGLGFPN